MKVGKKGNDYSGRAVEKKTPVKTVLRAIIIFAVYANPISLDCNQSLINKFK